MGSVAGGQLAAAVSRAGGLGLIGGGYGNADWIRREFQRAEGARVGIGFITWSLAKQPQLLDLALEHKPSAVMLSFGDPRPFAEKIRASGAKLICQVQSLAIARQALEAKADVLVAQGTEAGGHGGERSLFALLPAVKDLAPEKPLLAA
ncbi:MAG: nitronate monooxygenase, partial [Betaproteobacteria bacterium]